MTPARCPFPPVCDALCLDEIEEHLGFVTAYSDLAREHCKANDLAGLEYDMRVTAVHLRCAIAAFGDIAARRKAIDTPEAA